MSISQNLKQKRDAEARYRQDRTVVYSSGNTGADITDGYDTRQPGTGIPNDGDDSPYVDFLQALDNHINSSDPHPNFIRRDEGALFLEFEFFGLKDWFVVHNLGRVPSVTVWRFSGIESFGKQPFGTSPFGGSEPTEYVVDFVTPIISRLNNNTLKVSWPNAVNGKVVVVG